MERAELRGWLAESDGADLRGDFVFLRDPQWGSTEKLAAEAFARGAAEVDGQRGWLCIPTGGTSGQLRFARHDEATLAASVTGFCIHFEVTRVNAVGVLPLHHVSGLMARIRSAATGGRYRHWEWKRLALGEWPSLEATGADRAGWFISLVPTQLQVILERPGGPDFLRQFRAVLIGGGPTWRELENRAAEARIPLALSYGMTETAAMIAAQTPHAFLAGERDAGRPMPHAKIELDDEASDERCAIEVPGRIRVSGPSVFRGYYPNFQETRTFDTEDLGVFTRSGTLRILGRRDAAIITGGKKVWPAEVEAALRETGAFSDVAVLGVADLRWGMSVVAFYPREGLRGSIDDVIAILEKNLAPYKRPKRFTAIADWPRNAQGKVNRAKLRELAERSESV